MKFRWGRLASLLVEERLKRLKREEAAECYEEVNQRKTQWDHRAEERALNQQLAEDLRQ